MNVLYRAYFVVIVLIFSGYNLLVYRQNSESPVLSEKALEGADLWQANNCIACHQLYGLGGYLGPDLTNLTSHPQKGVVYARAFLNSGIKSMPRFVFDEKEQDALLQFFIEVDKTGKYPLGQSVIKPNGWVELPLKEVDL